MDLSRGILIQVVRKVWDWNSLETKEVKNKKNLSLRNATDTAVKKAERIARGLVRNPNPVNITGQDRSIMMKQVNQHSYFLTTPTKYKDDHDEVVRSVAAKKQIHHNTSKWSSIPKWIRSGDWANTQSINQLKCRPNLATKREREGSY